MNESYRKTELVRQAKGWGWYARRIESRGLVGIPDIIMKPPGMGDFWIEAKILHGYSYGPTPRQLVDLLALHDPPNTCAGVLAFEEHPSGGVMYYIAAPAEKIHIERMDVMRSPNPEFALKEFLRRTGHDRST